ncbi:MAG: nucleotidyltransferase domain-containing protein [Candidatus Woesearchaeota archaeon]
MLTKQQLNILSVFTKNLFGALTFKQIKEQSRQKSNNVTQIALKEFLKNNLVTTKIIGDVTTYSLNLNSYTYSYLNLINEIELKRKKIPSKVLNDIRERITKYTPFFILLVFGSYAKGSVTQKSDLDVAVIVESEQSKKEISPFIETVKRREATGIDYHIFTSAEFVEMLRSEQENLGKEIYRENIIHYGTIAYYIIIKGLKNEYIS